MKEAVEKDDGSADVSPGVQGLYHSALPMSIKLWSVRTYVHTLGAHLPHNWASE
jgi:hypothetical protein